MRRKKDAKGREEKKKEGKGISYCLTLNRLVSLEKRGETREDEERKKRRMTSVGKRTRRESWGARVLFYPVRLRLDHEEKGREEKKKKRRRGRDCFVNTVAHFDGRNGLEGRGDNTPRRSPVSTRLLSPK